MIERATVTAADPAALPAAALHVPARRGLAESARIEEALIEQMRLTSLAAEVSRALVQDGAQAESLAACVRALHDHLEAQLVQVWTLDDRRQALVLRASAGAQPPSDRTAAPAPLADPIVRRVAELRLPHITDEPAGGGAPEAVAAYPLLAAGSLLGVLALRPSRPLSPLAQTVLGSIADILALGIEAQRAQATLRDSETRHRLLFDANPQPMWIYDDATLALLTVNRAAERHYGWSAEEARRLTLADLHVPEDRAAVRESMRNGRSWPGSGRLWQHRRKDGSRITVEMRSHPLDLSGRPCHLMLVNDVSERQLLEQHLRQKQKMEAIGLLAGGVAHDFNNLLTVISGYAALAARGLPDGSKTGAQVHEIGRAAERAAALTNQLLAFSRQQVLQPRVIALNALLADIQGLLRRIIGEDVEMVLAPAAGLGQVLADPGQIEQVVMNLVVNARDAMPRGGRITLTTANARLEAARDDAGFSVEAGDYVLLEVRDEGIGMDAATRARVFEPFFTTKEKSKGTGLGLSTVYGVVKQSGGYVWLHSEPGRGCSVKVYLPRVEEQGAAAAAPARRPPTGQFAVLGQTVLLAEDEDSVRALAAEVLTRSGYSVLAAADGRQALDLCRRHRGPVDLLVTDVVMPEMSGPELAHRVAELHPQARILYISGYPERAADASALAAPGANFLGKPFLPRTLIERVRDALRPAAEAMP
jgi:hypothetical protein